MEWTNLKENKCPKCEEYLEGPIDGMYFCSDIECNFKIREERLEELLEEMEEDPEEGFGDDHDWGIIDSNDGY